MFKLPLFRLEILATKHDIQKSGVGATLDSIYSGSPWEGATCWLTSGAVRNKVEPNVDWHRFA